MSNNIRYYRKLFPVAEDIITAKITGISDDDGIYADCVEYPDLKLFILPTEIKKRKINLRKFFSPDKLYPVLTLSVDINKKLADVSYKKINENDRSNYLEKFYVLQKIYKFGLEVSKLYSSFTGIELFQSIEFIFDKTIWNIFDEFTEHDKNIEDINEFYMSLLEDPLKLFNEDNSLDEFKEYFIQNIKKRIKITDIVLSTEIKLICLQTGAIEKIKNTLKTDIDSAVQIKCISSPRYELIVTNRDKSKAEELINNTIEIIKNNCGKFNVNFLEQSNICVLKDKIYSFN